MKFLNFCHRTMSDLEEWMKTHVKWVPKASYVDAGADPVFHCQVYKQECCTHVDGFLCKYEDCDIRLNYQGEKNGNTI